MHNMQYIIHSTLHAQHAPDKVTYVPLHLQRDRMDAAVPAHQSELGAEAAVQTEKGGGHRGDGFTAAAILRRLVPQLLQLMDTCSIVVLFNMVLKCQACSGVISEKRKNVFQKERSE